LIENINESSKSWKSCLEDFKKIENEIEKDNQTNSYDLELLNDLMQFGHGSQSKN
jgi:hypothetical protein